MLHATAKMSTNDLTWKSNHLFEQPASQLALAHLHFAHTVAVEAFSIVMKSDDATLLTLSLSLVAMHAVHAPLSFISSAGLGF